MASIILNNQEFSPQQFATLGDAPSWLNDVQQAIRFWLSDAPLLVAQTSGSTGAPKPILISRKMLETSVAATINYFQLSENKTAALVIPTAFIGGKMMVFRALSAQLKLYVFEPTTHLNFGNTHIDFAPMTPMQAAQNLSQLQNINKVLLGGGPIPADLETKLLACDTKAWHSYGMTETASHVALRKIGEPIFKALAGVNFSLNEESCLCIHAPEWGINALQTNDLVELVDAQSFIWLGRRDNVVNSGGVKIFPEKIEALLSPYIEKNFMITGVPHAMLGEQLVLIIEGENHDSISFEYLPKLWRPKKIYVLPQFIYTENGKLNRAETRRQILSLDSKKST